MRIKSDYAVANRNRISFLMNPAPLSSRQFQPEEIFPIADMLNITLFGQTAKQSRDTNQSDMEDNMHEHATIKQLLVLADKQLAGKNRKRRYSMLDCKSPMQLLNDWRVVQQYEKLAA